MLPRTLIGERMELIARRTAKIVKALCSINHSEAFESAKLNIGR